MNISCGCFLITLLEWSNEHHWCSHWECFDNAPLAYVFLWRNIEILVLSLLLPIICRVVQNLQLEIFWVFLFLEIFIRLLEQDHWNAIEGAVLVVFKCHLPSKPRSFIPLLLQSCRGGTLDLMSEWLSSLMGP